MQQLPPHCAVAVCISTLSRNSLLKESRTKNHKKNNQIKAVEWSADRILSVSGHTHTHVGICVCDSCWLDVAVFVLFSLLYQIIHNLAIYVLIFFYLLSSHFKMAAAGWDSPWTTFLGPPLWFKCYLLYCHSFPAGGASHTQWRVRGQMFPWLWPDFQFLAGCLRHTQSSAHIKIVVFCEDLKKSNSSWMTRDRTRWSALSCVYGL